jgi:thiamine pyrophosphate-dependent acetolactate synthase large subunit-like protein
MEGVQTEEREEGYYGSDLIVDLLCDLGIKYVALNPGSSIRGLHDSLVNRGRRCGVELIECLHEEIAVAVAHGYALATGEPAAVALHDIVGLLHAPMAIFNAYYDGVPMIVLGGTGPLELEKRRSWIDWIHTALVNGNFVRDLVKWDYQPSDPADAAESLIRGFITSVTEPKAPVYLCYDVGLQEAKVDHSLASEYRSKVKGRRYKVSTPINGDQETLDRIAESLIHSETPVILAGNTGRNWKSVDYLVKLAETASVGVMDSLERFNFPNVHPLDLTGTRLLEEADFILALDVKNVQASIRFMESSYNVSPLEEDRVRVLRKDVKIGVIGLEELRAKSSVLGYQRIQETDIQVMADTSTALPYLVRRISEVVEGDPGLRRKLEERASKYREVHQEVRRRWEEQLRRRWDERPMSPARAAYEMWRVLSNEDWALSVGTLRGWARRIWEWTKPWHYHGHPTSGGGGQGFALPATVGIALAYKGTGRSVLGLIGDGNALYTFNSIWTASHHRVPVIAVIENNLAYYNDVEHQVAVAKSRGRSMEEARIGVEIRDPNVNFAKMAESLGGVGFGPIEDPGEVQNAMLSALRVTRTKSVPVVIDLIVKPR